VIPFARDLNDPRSNVVLYEAKGFAYRILLDTGNRAGWTIHHPGLLAQLKSRQGGRMFSEIGTHAGFLEGSFVFTKTLQLGALRLTGLAGLFIPKPQPDFYDAALNPAFIRNRSVTLDYGEGTFRLDPPGIPGPGSGRTTAGARLPWFGDRYVYVPVKANGKDGLALIETGAKDIALNLDFARKFGCPLTSRTRYLASGEAVSYHETALSVSLGPFVFERGAVEVWPFQQLRDPLTGLVPDVVIGPEALAGSFILTLDPFENVVLIGKRGSP